MPLIENGTKSATVRVGHRNGKDHPQHYRTGKVLAVAHDRTSKIPIIIEKVIFTKFSWQAKGINGELLKREGMTDHTETGFHELYLGLKAFYPDFNYDDDVTVVHFKK